MNMNKTIELTQEERNGIDFFCKDLPGGKGFGQMVVREYYGMNSQLKALNGTAKIIGTAVNEGDYWIVRAIDGERYRIPEPKGGIDEVLNIEFHRNVAN